MEELYHYLWQFRMLGRPMRLTGGEPVEVLDPGVHNHDSGPDFFNAKVNIGDTHWVGNVEIHVRSSDWYRHGHDRDRTYDSVIIHAVGEADREVSRTDGTPIPQLELTMPPEFFRTVGELVQEMDSIRCSRMLRHLSPLTVTDWLESLAIERMQTKAKRIHDVCQSTGGDWEQAAFVALARALGFGLNSEPFEMLGRSLPLKFVKRHSDNLMQVEALLFGQAGMLDTSIHIFDDYYQLLCREYYFLARKYGLRPMRPEVWKYSKTRPQNFPHRRIAFLAALLHSGVSLPSAVMERSSNLEEIRSLFRLNLTGYWLTHSGFDLPSATQMSRMGETSINLLLINFAAPLIYAYSCWRGDMDQAEKGLDILTQLPGENNSRVRQWTQLGFTNDSAFRSQALLQLRNEYCLKRKCLYCRFGHNLLRKSVKES